MRRTPTRMLRGRVKRGEDLDRSDALLVRALAHGLPEGTKFVVGRAIGYQRSARLDRAGAREAFSRSLSLDPGQPKVKQYLAQL